MTGKALSVNKEWNTNMVSTAEGEMYKNIQSAFDALWEDKNHTSRYEDFFFKYCYIDRPDYHDKIILEVMKPDLRLG